MISIKIVGGYEEYVELIKNKKGNNIPDNVKFGKIES